MTSEWQHWSTLDHGRHALSFWRDAVCAGVIDSELRAESDADFSGTMFSQTRSGARLVNFASSPHVIRRSRQHLSRLNGDHIMLGLQLQGRAIMSQGDAQVCLEAGEFGLLDAGSAFDIAFPEQTARRLMLLPRQALRARAPNLRRLQVPLRLSSDMAFAPLLAETLRMLTQVDQSLESRTVDTLMETVIEIVALQCRSMAGTEPAASTELTFTNIKRHIHLALSDPGLSPASAAAASQVSVRTLHRLFARHAQLSFEAYVLQARLALAREILVVGRAPTVSDVAFACGFNNLSHFTRRFSERYGELPVNLLRQVKSGT